jgi:uncharacterized membrane protein
MCQDRRVAPDQHDDPEEAPMAPALDTTIELSSKRAFDRLVNFADAVVAIAITLLVLPLISIPGPTDGQTVWNVINDNLGSIIAFVVSFYIVASLWVAHNRVMNQLRAYDDFVLWVNIFWLAGIAFMPWAAAMYGQRDSWYSGGEGFGGVGLLFFGTLATLSIITSILANHVERHQYLIAPENLNTWRQRFHIGRVRGLSFAGLFIAIAALSLVIPQIASFLPIAILPLGVILGKWETRYKRRQRDSHHG